MARGRIPTPTAINTLKGDPGNRRRNQVEPDGPEGVPEAPDYLCPVALAEWNAIVPLLSTMGVLSKIDGPAIVSYCEAWARYRYAADYITANGPINEQGRLSPMNRVIAENQALVKAYLIEFGATAAARARMRVTPKEKPKASKWSGNLRVV